MIDFDALLKAEPVEPQEQEIVNSEEMPVTENTNDALNFFGSPAPIFAETEEENGPKLAETFTQIREDRLQTLNNELRKLSDWTAPEIPGDLGSPDDLLTDAEQQEMMALFYTLEQQQKKLLKQLQTLKDEQKNASIFELKKYSLGKGIEALTAALANNRRKAQEAKAVGNLISKEEHFRSLCHHQDAVKRSKEIRQEIDSLTGKQQPETEPTMSRSESLLAIKAARLAQEKDAAAKKSARDFAKSRGPI